MDRASLQADAGQDPREAVLRQLVAERFSCRAYRADPVPRPVIEQILSIAQFSASWCNSQPWRMIITEGQGTDRLRQALMADVLANPQASPDFPFPERYAGVFLDRKRQVGWQLYESLGIQRGDREASRLASLENFNLFGAPHVAIVTTERELGLYGAVDCGFYAATFLLAAQTFGVATTAQAALAQRAAFLHRYFDIPEQRQVLFGIAFGYPDEAHPANAFSSLRAELGEVVDWVRE